MRKVSRNETKKKERKTRRIVLSSTRNFFFFLDNENVARTVKFFVGPVDPVPSKSVDTLAGRVDTQRIHHTRAGVEIGSNLSLT